VCAPEFQKSRSKPEHTSETNRRLSSVSNAPHRIYLALKSPIIISGCRKCDIKFVSSAGGNFSDASRYMYYR
jgi:hypothetical protein